ncbi:tripartite tricarboxylate transporter permease [Thermodesulfobacteriota bacterium]
MTEWDTWVNAASLVFQWQNLLLIFSIAVLGLVIGFLPGIGPINAITLILPLTYGMSPSLGLIVLGVLYDSTTYGGSVSAILLNTPGTAASAATCFDGYPMAKQGKGGVAIGISMMSSLMGGVVGLAGLIFLSPVISDVALKFQPAEYFMIAVLGLMLVSTSVKGSMLKATISGAFGVLASCVGMDIMTGQPRFTFGTHYLQAGIPFISLIVGLFAFSEVLFLIVQKKGTIAEKGTLSGKIIDGLKEPFSHLKTVVRSALIGLGIGIIPGEGAAVANTTAYLAEVRASKHPESFGTGVPEGVIAPETSNNACIFGALIPTLTVGIPGGGVAAVFLGGVMMHGLNPGLELFSRHKDVLYTLFFGLTFSHVLIFFVGTMIAKYLAKVTIIPINILVPPIIAIGITSIYLMRNNIIDVVVAIVSGAIAYFMRKYGYSLIPFLVGFILAPIAERSFYQSLLLADGSYWTFAIRPISGTILFLIILVVALPPVLKKVRRRQ